MDETRWQQVKRIFHDVVGLADDEREARLESACGEDDALRNEIEELLRAYDVSDDFAVPPSEESVAGWMVRDDGSGRDPEPGDRIGAYRIDHLAGRGGMAVVYVAERVDGTFEKRVALKVIRRAVASDDARRRFRVERQTLAALEHPAIARLHDGGSLDDGRPYLVMEYVDGVPIDQYCAEHGRDVRGRVELFLRVCDAVEYAHRHLVVHRDLKPANILVTSDGAPKLLDFGIAALLDEKSGRPDEGGEHEGPADARSRVVSHPLTLGYASPEHILGESVTTASDVYSLGVVLYELLCGAPPHEREGDSTTRRERILGTEPLPPSERVSDAASRRRIAGDLDAIAGRAMARDASDRYGSVESFAKDLRRHLDGRPVDARPCTIPYVFGRFVHRNRLAVGTAVLVTALLTIGVLALFDQRARLEVAWEHSESARGRAERSLDFLRDMLASVDPSRDGPEVPLRDVLDDAARRLEHEFHGSASGSLDASTREELALEAELHAAIGNAYRGLGLYDRSTTHLERAYDLTRRVHSRGEGALDGDVVHEAVAQRLRDLGALDFARGEFERAAERLRIAVSIYEATTGARTLDLAVAKNDLAVVSGRIGRVDEAEALFEDALAIRRERLGARDLAVAETLNNLSSLRRQQERIEDALDLLEQSLAIRRELLPSDHLLLAQSLSNLAVLEGQSGDWEGARDRLREALQVGRRQLGSEHPELAAMLGNLAFIELRLGDPAAAETLLAECTRLRSSFLEADDLHLAMTRATWAECLLRTEDPARARAQLDLAIDVIRAAYGAGHEQTRRYEALLEQAREQGSATSDDGEG